MGADSRDPPLKYLVTPSSRNEMQIVPLEIRDEKKAKRAQEPREYWIILDNSPHPAELGGPHSIDKSGGAALLLSH